MGLDYGSPDYGMESIIGMRLDSYSFEPTGAGYHTTIQYWSLIGYENVRLDYGSLRLRYVQSIIGRFAALSIAYARRHAHTQQSVMN